MMKKQLSYLKTESNRNVPIDSKGKKMKKTLKLIGIESLYLLAVTLVYLIATALQYVKKKFVGESTSFMFNESAYSVNPFFYILGILIFAAFLFFSYKLFLRPRIDSLFNGKKSVAAAYIVVTFIFMFVMLIAETLVFVFGIGFANTIKPEFLMYVSWTGFPTAVFLLMIYSITFAIKRDE